MKSELGLELNQSGKKITLKGVKPQPTLQWHYDYYYLYGLIEPINQLVVEASCLARFPCALRRRGVARQSSRNFITSVTTPFDSFLMQSLMGETPKTALHR